MSVAGQTVYRTRGGSAFALFICVAASIMLFAVLLYQLNISPVPLLLACAGATVLWVAWRQTLSCLGAFLAFMPVFTLLFLVAKFFGPSYLGKLEGIDRVVLLLLTLIFLKQNGIKLVSADWLLFLSFAIALVRLPLDGSLLALAGDFGFLIPYMAGRATHLTTERQEVWARRGIWILAIVSILGLVEVFGIGEGPRALLYLSVAETATAGGGLNAAFHAHGFSGVRESAFMLGPLQFAPMCMTALILWWVYSRKLLPGIMIATGLVCTVTRSAWVGAAVAIFALSASMGQKKRLFVYSGIALALFAILIPVLGLQDYLLSNRQGDDPSAEQHQNSMLEGVVTVASNPLGAGSANIGRQATKDNDNATYFESAYLTLAGEYGIPTLFCLVGFLVAVFRISWRLKTKLGFASMGVVTGLAAVMAFASIHDVFPVAAWVWFPVGLAVRSSTQADQLKPPQQAD